MLSSGSLPGAFSVTLPQAVFQASARARSQINRSAQNLVMLTGRRKRLLSRQHTRFAVLSRHELFRVQKAPNSLFLLPKADFAEREQPVADVIVL